MEVDRIVSIIEGGEEFGERRGNEGRRIVRRREKIE
jgi:hypothetical protein